MPTPSWRPSPTPELLGFRQLPETALHLRFASGREYICKPVEDVWFEAIEQAESDEASRQYLHAAVTTWEHPEATVADDAKERFTSYTGAARDVASIEIRPETLARALTVGRTHGITVGRIPTNTDARPVVFAAYVAAVIEQQSSVSRTEAATAAAMTVNEVVGPSVGASDVERTFSQIPLSAIQNVCSVAAAAEDPSLTTWERAE